MEEWPLDGDGIPHRHAARVLLLAPDGRVYMIRGHDYADASHAWWFTVGGGLEDGESPRLAACRECAEETGLSVSPDRLEGPVLQRYATFRFVEKTRRQDEDYFVLRLDEAEVRAVGEGSALTVQEREVLDEFAWMSAEDLRAVEASGMRVYPQGLTSWLDEWIDGWSGECRVTYED